MESKNIFDLHADVLNNYKLATALAHEQKFFHWFVEFPDVINSGEFDCILGNPPFLGGQKISTALGVAFLKYLHFCYQPASGTCDLVAYFFRRAFSIVKVGGFNSLISTNTISQGDTRLGGLEKIIQDGGEINHAVRSMRWPGEAAVVVALVTVHRGKSRLKKFLADKEVTTITSLLDDSSSLGNPYTLKSNEEKSFVGSYVLGLGYTLDPTVAGNIIARDKKYEKVLFPYLNGDDLNNNPVQKPSRWVINYFDWPLRRYTNSEWDELADQERLKISERLREKKNCPIAPPEYNGHVAKDFPECLSILEQYVKPERQRWKKDENGKELIGEFALRDPLPKLWWIYGEKRPALYKAIAPLDKVLVHTRVTKTHGFVFVPNGWVYSEAIVVFTDNRFAVLQSSLHESWAWNYSSSMKGDRRYSASDAYETFPFPKHIGNTAGNLKLIGESYHKHRQDLMSLTNLGLTKTYNMFHTKYLTSVYIEAQTKKPSDICEKAYASILRLRELHVEMDQTVLESYGWTDIQLRHDFYEVDYLPENDRIRFTIHPDVRKEILKRLLELNHKLHQEEVNPGLWDKKNASSKNKKATTVNDPGTGYGSLFSN